MPEAFIPTPGRYLQMRRHASGLTIDFLALGLETAPPVSHRSRVELLAAIEADVQPITPGIAILLHQLFRFDPHVLDVLLLRAAGQAVNVPQICRGCGCTWFDACATSLGGCAWSQQDPSLCTACVAAGVEPAGDDEGSTASPGTNQEHFDRLGTPLSDRPGHTASCAKFETHYPWKCDCHAKAEAPMQAAAA